MAGRSETSGGRRQAIIRAAERLFALEGYHGATMRQIAEEAGVKLSLVVYHFTSKLGLYSALFEERRYVNDERLARLKAIPDLRADDAVEQIVSSFTDPVLALHDDPDDVWFARLVLREASDPSSQERPVIRDQFDPLARQFVEALSIALPDKPAGFHHWAYLYSVGALTQSAFDTRVRNIADEPGYEHKHALLRSYITAALRYG
ncbi:MULTISPECIES: TetR/AcrR family transcriptional regulator [unclassified Streptomyces]|uniref:TetR/AcrR family transcriptional regulator n=1 Tax=unclassified Streptomyces TaxID=2593676 RepID=UPI00168B7BBE|nr:MULTISPECIES: TetR/AcrR family transcriptional regulator [unclassified Streptomyces]MBD3003902.1 TetR/AcrR family transcriptional regulator [Streptomyces sp. 5-10]